MNKIMSTFGIIILLTGCSKSDVDARAVLPGTWACSDGIVMVLNQDGTHEWQVPPGSGNSILGDNAMVRNMPNGGYALLGKWRVADGTLEMDMIADTDKFKVTFLSSSKMELDGPESYSCIKQ